MAAPTKQVKVSPEYAEYLEKTRDAINAELNLSLGIPDVTRILLHTKDEPRVVIALRRRPGRGGTETIFK